MYNCTECQISNVTITELLSFKKKKKKNVSQRKGLTISGVFFSGSFRPLHI